MADADRGVSTVFSYALILGIVALLSATMLTSMIGFVDGQQRETTHSTLEVVGEGVAADLERADRLVAAADRPRTVELTSSQPDRVVGSHYEIEIADAGGDGRYEITLEDTASDVSVTVAVRTRTPIEPATVAGGDLEIVHDADGDTLEVRGDRDDD